MSMTMFMDREPRDTILGRLVRSAYEFMNEGERQPGYLLMSPVDDKLIPARDLFSAFRYRGRDEFIVKSDKLPLEATVLGVLTKGGNVVFETGKFDKKELKLEIEKQSPDFELRGRSFWFNEGKVIDTYSMNVGTFDDMDLRTAYTILPGYNTTEWEGALKTVDFLYNYGTFASPPLGGEEGPAMPPRLELRQEMSLQQVQTLRALQIPRLALQQTALLAKIIHNARILKMSANQLRQHIDKEVSSNPALRVD